MSQEKIREIIKKDIMIHGDNCYCNFCIPGGELDQVSAEINKIVLECLPEKKITVNNSAFLTSRVKQGFNEAIAEFKANWEAE